MRALRSTLFLVTVFGTTVLGWASSQRYVDNVTGSESGGNYAIFNTAGTTQALGRYQFLPSTFSSLGYTTYTGGPRSQWSSYVFNDAARSAGVGSLSDLRYSDAGARLQDAAMTRFTDNNLASFSSSTRNSIGSTVAGRPVTTDGLLSAAHFLGAGGLNAWVASGFSASGLPASVVAANGGNAAALNEYLLNRMGKHAGETWVGGEGVEWAGAMGDTTDYTRAGMYDATEGFPGFGSKRQVVIQETLPFQGDRKSLGGA